MTDGGCPHLAYRRTDPDGGGDAEFDPPRAYCTVAGRFVQPMRADVCNDRYDLNHAEHCEIYREHEGLGDGWPPEDGGDGGERDGADGDAENGTGADGEDATGPDPVGDADGTDGGGDAGPDGDGGTGA